MLLLATSCANTRKTTARDAREKIEFDLGRLDEHGLRGPRDGNVSLAYEFCIPNTDRCKAQVKAIDRTVQFMPGSRGRIGAGKEECLCIGETHQENYRTVLRSLAELPFIERIIECHFE
ncbi:MAG: hypothetical protein HQ559_09140 [Lentisphaerae bacterium]|nr:hypothetical protein [Lentisphaerota bacterium]